MSDSLFDYVRRVVNIVILDTSVSFSNFKRALSRYFLQFFPISLFYEL